ncbi:hypothetical protein NQ314_012270 [Rhamnusium bicolor]|uniref:DNA methyltransferase 2 n=1 Tax=Rhamnusium bicolor TaxID=1586634 RepID=A0AAV8XDM3_9CUCU|nr:hypothetical protein NQ314_012270 [Rhamnusium bicolor]
MRVLELYSGIGGMHLALRESGVEGKVIVSIEINNVANEIYKHNFPNTRLLNLNIEGLSPKFINDLHVDTILMSPPCQPFTRNGLKNDTKDPRTASFLHVLKLLPDLNITRILIENVKGFELSEMRNILVQTLKDCKFVYQEFLLSPHQIGIPNSRCRYYCLAKKIPAAFSFHTGELMEKFPFKTEEQECFPISEILEKSFDGNHFLTDATLTKRIKVVDICYSDSRRSCCFTKAYGRFLEGSGSIFTDKTQSETLKIIDKANLLPDDSSGRLQLLRSLNLRFFTPREICRLMCFPESFTFPNSVNNRKKYMVLGNSINIKVVSELIKLLNI